MQISESIKREHFNKWLELFKACNGRFLCDPLDLFGSTVSVFYSFDKDEDYIRFCENWNRLNINVVEKKRGIIGKIRAALGL